MNNRFFFLAAALVTTTGLAVQDAQADEPSWPLEVFETMDAHRIAVFPRLEDILDSPAWRPGESRAPLGVDEAMALASRVETEKGNLAHAAIGEIKLLPINDRRAGDRWYYLVKVIDGARSQNKPHFVAVLMNGTTVPAIVEPESVR